ncbi:Uncharacterised protein [Candidatus Tiddalikarchaeum anstoanum]|nr:Uncharacterised protein [Candidatus Tiddalikarchaeum anstoanum]
MKYATALLVLLTLLVAGCTKLTEQERVCNCNCLANPAENFQSASEELPNDFNLISSQVCSDSALSNCIIHFDSNISRLYYAVYWNGDANLTLKLYQNDSLYEELNVSSNVLNIQIPTCSGGDWVAKLFANNQEINSKEFTISYRTPVRLGDVTSRSVNTDSDVYRDAIEVFGVKLYDANSCVTPEVGTASAYVYGIKLNQTTGFILNYEFLDEWHIPVNTADDNLLLPFHSNTTNVFDFDYGQLHITVETEFGNFSTFNPYVSILQ